MDEFKSESVEYVKLVTMLKNTDLKDDDIDAISNIIKESLRGMVDYLLDAAVDEIKSSPHYVEALRTIVKALRVVYNNTGKDTGATDSEYDILAEKLELVDDLENDIEDQVHFKNKGYHLYPCLRGTLDKIYYLGEKDKNSNRRSLQDWINTCKRKLNDRDAEEFVNSDIYVFPKWDGVSVIFEMDENDQVQRALTRGYTALNEACIVTNTFKYLIDDEGRLPLDSPLKKGEKHKYGVKTEVMTSDMSLIEYNLEHPNSKYKNTRSFASAIINGEVADPELTRQLRIIPLRYQVLSNTILDNTNGQKLHPGVFNYPYITCKLRDIDLIEDFAADHHTVITYDGDSLRCDGAVICMKDEKWREYLGRENDREKSEVAYKFTEEYAYTKIKSVKYSVGLYGTITPVLSFAPVTMKGNEVSNVSLGSIGKLNEMNLGKDDVVKIGYDIIPVCNFDLYDPKCKHSKEPRFDPPSDCPACGQTLEYTENTAICRNPKCPSRVMGRIKNHVTRLRIKYIGDSLIEQMYYTGICRDIPDIYKLVDKKKKLTELPGFGNKKFKILMNEIEEVEAREIDEARLLSSLSLERLSYATFRRVLSEYTLDELLDIVDNGEFAKLEIIPGIGSTTARWLIAGLSNKKNRKNLAFLQQVLTVSTIGKSKPRFTLCFSSFSPGDNRINQAEDLVMNQGGVVVDSVTKETTYLVVPDKRVNSNKVKKANKYGIPIFTAEEFIQRSIPQD